MSNLQDKNCQKIVEDKQRERDMKFFERMNRNQEMAKKIAQILAEDGAAFLDVDEIFAMSKKHLIVTFDSENKSK